LSSFTAIFLLYFLIVVIIKVAVFRMRGEEGGDLKDNWTFPAIFTSYLVAVMGSLAEFFLRTPEVNPFVSLSGYVLATGGVIITRRCVMTLGRWWSVRIEIKKGHQVVEEGPYRISRHPYYLATLLELGGLSLILNSFRTLLYIVLVHIPILVARISSEERVLSRALSPTYPDYKKRTRVIPLPLRGSLRDTQSRSCSP